MQAENFEDMSVIEKAIALRRLKMENGDAAVETAMDTVGLGSRIAYHYLRVGKRFYPLREALLADPQAATISLRKWLILCDLPTQADIITGLSIAQIADMGPVTLQAHVDAVNQSLCEASRFQRVTSAQKAAFFADTQRAFSVRLAEMMETATGPFNIHLRVMPEQHAFSLN